ncbi:MAG: hypothetical protein A2Z75_04265, partial [Chloroflexi bacterium RBG_13_50_10]
SLSDKSKKILKEEVIPYWRNRCVEARIDYMLPKKIRDLEDKLWTWSITKNTSGASHFGPAYETLLKTGLGPLKTEAENRLAALDFAIPDSYGKPTFYRSALIVLEAIFDFAHRYAELARGLAAKETDPLRRSELNQIAENCQWVPERPPRTFWEALQFVWFVHMILIMETGGFGPWVQRADQYLYPYYKKEVKEGRLTAEQAQELLDSWWNKFGETTCVLTAQVAEYFAGFPVWQTISIGGQTADGKDATNDLTHMMLDAELHTRLHQPEFGARIHENCPVDYLRHVCETITKARTGKPMLLTDKGVMSMYISRFGAGREFVAGEPDKSSAADGLMEMVRDYTINSCGGAGPVSMAGKYYVIGETNFINGGLPKYLELALNNGHDRLTGELIGAETGDPRKFTSFDDVLRAYKKQIEYIMPILMVPKNVLYEAHAEVSPCAFESVLTDGCMDRGLDCTRGGAVVNGVNHYSCGAADLGDELAAIKKLVFDDKAISMSELIDALDVNFKGKEDLRQRLLNRAPKYGNDDDYVDKLLCEVYPWEEEELHKYACPRGGLVYYAGFFTLSQNVPMGRAVGATPDGRKAREPLGEGGASPYQGRDKNGPTATMKSVAKLFQATKSQGVFNMRFAPQAVESEEGLQKFMSLIKSYNDMAGWHVQFNVVSNETLRAAQKQPQQYKDLMVRVAGFSAFFTQLSRDVQDNIIARTEHHF